MKINVFVNVKTEHGMFNSGIQDVSEEAAEVLITEGFAAQVFDSLEEVGEHYDLDSEVFDTPEEAEASADEGQGDDGDDTEGNDGEGAAVAEKPAESQKKGGKRK